MDKIFLLQLDNYHEYEDIFPEWPDITLEWFVDPRRVNLKGGHAVFHKNNNPIATKLITDIRDLCNNYFHENDVPIEFTKCRDSWTIQYEVGSFHELHKHRHDHEIIRSRPIYTVVLSFDDIQDELLYVEPLTEKPQMFCDIPGQIKVFRSDILMHGVYPVTQRRRVFIADYFFKKKTIN